MEQQLNREGGKSDGIMAREPATTEDRQSGAGEGCVSVESVSGERVWRVPSLREIQQSLVKIRDKPPEFAGSRDWIGCFEACLVLDHLFSVSSLSACAQNNYTSSDNVLLSFNYTLTTKEVCEN